MKTETWSMNGLHAVLWQPEGPTRAILQITHGMTEHMGRYESFAAALCSQGIAVAGFDLRGHGKGVTALLGMLRKAGMHHLECHQFPNARHDIFHEASAGTADAVRNRITAWLSNQL